MKARILPRGLEWLVSVGALPPESIGMHDDVLTCRIVDAIGDVRFRRHNGRWVANHGEFPFWGATKLESVMTMMVSITYAKLKGDPLPIPTPRRAPRLAQLARPALCGAEPEIERARRLV